MEQNRDFSSHGNASLIIGVDVGGTKIAAGLVDRDGQVSGRVKIPTDTSHPAKTLQAIADAISGVMQEAVVSAAQIKAIGLGIPGIVDPVRGTCLFSANLGWENVAVQDWLEQATGLPCAIENDVSAGALGESLYGAGQGQRQMVYLSLGTGIAARAIINGQLYNGAHGMAGEIGHLMCDPTGPRCRCGAIGCLEALAAGPALAEAAQQKIQDGSASPLLLKQLQHPEEQMRAEHVFAAAALGDSVAHQIIQRAARYLAYGLSFLVFTYDPQCIVIGGGLATEQSPLMTAIHQETARWIAQSPVARGRIGADIIRPARLQQDAGIVGAGALILAQERTQ
jgi:glucokinase